MGYVAAGVTFRRPTGGDRRGIRAIAMSAADARRDDQRRCARDLHPDHEEHDQPCETTPALVHASARCEFKRRTKPILVLSARAAYDQDQTNPAGRPGDHAERNRSAFPTTETELSDIASAAMSGDSSTPKNGYKTPAAIGTPSAL